MDKNSNSFERSRKSTIKVSNILIPAGITVLTGPGGGIAYGILKVLVEHAQDFIKDRNEQRIILFHETLLAGTIGEKEVNDFFDRDIDLEEYHKLLRSAIQDDEDKKTYYYAELLRKIILNQIPENLQNYLVKIVRELNAFEIGLLREMYIYEKFPLIPQNHFSFFESSSGSLLHGDNLENQFATEKFFRLCLTKRNEEDEIIITKQTLEAVKAFFKECDLTPKSINRNQWRQDRAFLGIPSITDNDYYNFGGRIQKIFRENRILCDRQSLHILRDQKSYRLQNLKFLVLIISFDRMLSDELNLEYLKQVNDSLINFISAVSKENQPQIIKIFINQPGVSYGSLFENIYSNLIINVDIENIKEFESIYKNIDLKILDERIKKFY